MELGCRKVQFPHAFDINLLRPVHHDFGDAVVLQEWFNGSVPQDFIADVGYQAGPFATGHHKGIPFQHPLHVAGNDIFDFLPAVVRTIRFWYSSSFASTARPANMSSFSWTACSFFTFRPSLSSSVTIYIPFCYDQFPARFSGLFSSYIK